MSSCCPSLIIYSVSSMKLKAVEPPGISTCWSLLAVSATLYMLYYELVA